MENYDVNRDKFLDLMAKHHLDAGVNVVRLWNKAQEGDDIRPLAREFIADMLGQCLEAWKCAAGACGTTSPEDRNLTREDGTGISLWNIWERYLRRILFTDMLAHYIIEVAALAVVAALFWWGLIKEWKDE